MGLWKEKVEGFTEREKNRGREGGGKDELLPRWTDWMGVHEACVTSAFLNCIRQRKIR